MARRAKANGQDTAASILVILDRSGSMSSIAQATIDGYNQFRAEQTKLPGAHLGLVQFDSDGIDPLALLPVEQSADLDHNTYQPRAATPLYDAVGKSVTALEQQAPKGKVIVCIITDGYENSSHEWDQKRVFALVEQKRKDGWQFVFMGAGMDAYAVGGQIGVAAGGTYAYASTGLSTGAAFANLSNSSTMYRSGATADMAMPDHDTADPTYVPGGAPQSSTGVAPNTSGSWTSKPGGAPRSTTLPRQTLGPK